MMNPTAKIGDAEMAQIYAKNINRVLDAAIADGALNYRDTDILQVCGSDDPKTLLIASRPHIDKKKLLLLGLMAKQYQRTYSLPKNVRYLRDYYDVARHKLEDYLKLKATS